MRITDIKNYKHNKVKSNTNKTDHETTITPKRIKTTRQRKKRKKTKKTDTILIYIYIPMKIRQQTED